MTPSSKSRASWITAQPRGPESSRRSSSRTSTARSLTQACTSPIRWTCRSASPLTLSGRYDETRIRLSDRSGENPELDGSHDFDRFNPAGGVTFRPTPTMTLYASYGESARAPTPVELACASEDAPCNLPERFPRRSAARAGRREERRSRCCAAPPIAGTALACAEVSTPSISDDILFQTTGGPQANVGFFDNVGDTRRAGLELSLSQRLRVCTGSSNTAMWTLISKTASSSTARIIRSSKITRTRRKSSAKTNSKSASGAKHSRHPGASGESRSRFRVQ